MTSTNVLPTGAPVTNPTGTPGIAGSPGTPEAPRARFTLPLPAWMRAHHLQLWLGCGIVGVIALACLVGPWILRIDPNAQDLGAAFAAPSAAHPFGTDQLGRDFLARLLHGGRVDLFVAVVAVIVPFVVGSALGAMAGYFGGWIDTVVMRIADLVAAFPFYVLVIALVFSLGNGLFSIFVAISAVSWVSYARIVRGEVLVLREKEFIAACRTSGLSTWKILGRHVVPNSVGQSIIYAMSDIVLNIGLIVTLSFLGMGIVPPTPDWGQMMGDGQQYMAAGHYALIVVPGLCVVLVSLGLAFIGDGLSAVLKKKG
ncbi:ABC transporter permease [Brevibacterium samyangense]|uniref:ABC transporter permease n=1 Tax=Brevibacterium samyangense TaxID=366888 RepID=A0ABP5F0M3_9MICO